MNYNFGFLTPKAFEHLIQSLSRKILGNGLITFGDGPDGGREATFEGKAPFPGEEECWEGKWVIQAKFKTRDEDKDDFNWVKSAFEKEIEKLENREDKIEIPDNYLFFTNVVLTPVAKVGGRDKIEELIKTHKDKIKNIKIFGYDDLCGFLENNRDVATAYASFILPGDILQLLYESLQSMGTSKKNHHNLLGRFLESEFRDGLQSRLDHAGKLTSDRVNLEKVFVDLYATKDGRVPEDDKQKKFVESCIEEGNCILKPDTQSSRYVLIAGPGYGKSTVTHFLCQVYRAYFLNKIDNCPTPLSEINSFLEDLKKIIPITPTCFRFPFRVILKDFAGWIAEQKSKEKKHTFLLYLKYRLEKKGHGGTIEIEDIEQLLKTLSFVFIFDGLDEVPTTSNRADVLKEIDNFIDIDLRRYICDAMIIATTRPQGYTKEFDSSRYTHLTITDLEEQDCLEYLDKLLKNIDPVEDERTVHLEILEKALEDDIVSRLMKSPLQASIMAILVKSGGEPPRNKYDLFTDYYNTIFKRERQKNICKILSETPDYIHDIHFKLAFYLQLSSEHSANPSANISFDEFKKFVFEYLKSLELPGKEAETKTNQILQATTERLVFLEEVEDRKIGFNIRSIQEYFAANYYVRNQPDDIIFERLKYMCKSSYWRNTFLFALGYIYKHKNYIIDAVESICRELNGSTDDPHSTSGASVCKLGSWLALDILVEGIFRSNPKFENKFARLLEDLFTISLTQKHILFTGLSDDIKEKWILTYIEKYISQGTYDDQLTAWAVGTILFKFCFKRVIIKPLTKVFDKFWINGEAEVKVIKRFIELDAYNNGWFISKFLNALKRNPPFTFFEEFETVKIRTLFTSYSLIEKAVRSKFNDADTKKILLQNLFFLGLKKRYDIRGYLEMLNEFSKRPLFTSIVEVKDGVVILRERNILGHPKELGLKFFKKIYKSETFSIHITDQNLEELLGLFSEHNLAYLELLMAFLIKPNKTSLKKFVEKLADEPTDVITMVREHSSKTNWVLSEIFYNNDSLEQIIKDIDQNKYGDIGDWLEFEEKVSKNELDDESINFLRFLPVRRKKGNYLRVFIDFYEKYYLKYKDSSQIISKDPLYEAFVTFTALLHPAYIPELKEHIGKNRSMIDELLLALSKLNFSNLRKDYFNFALINLVYLLPEEEMVKRVQSERKLLEKFRIDKKSTIPILPKRISNFFPKLSRLLNIDLTLDKESPMIRILVWVLLDRELKTLPVIDINYNDLHRATFEHTENETCRILLCLVDPEMNQQKADRISEISKQLTHTEPKLPEYIIQLLEKFEIRGDWVEPFLLEIYKLVDKHNHNIKSTFEGYIKDLIESGPSHLNEEPIQKQLNLID